MPDFWENILRFPRIFFSSILGLLLTIIGPFFNLLKSPQTTIILLIVTLSIVAFLSLTLRAMLSLDIN
jgi:hypothetical protein